jgi:hypothetical protein
VSGERPSELARVLVEAGEIGMLVDWKEAELRQLYDELGSWLDDPDVTEEERDYATRTRALFEEAFAELREIVETDDEEAQP